MQASRIIGISGKMYSGKSTTADTIISKRPEYVRHSFATKLKQASSMIDNYSLSLAYTMEGKNTALPGNRGTVRESLQEIGEIMRTVYPNVWVNAEMGSYKNGDCWIFDDVRHPNEVRAIEGNGGVVIRLTRMHPDYEKLPEEIRFHISETALDDYDFKHYAPADATPEEIAEMILQLQ